MHIEASTCWRKRNEVNGSNYLLIQFNSFNCNHRYAGRAVSATTATGSKFIYKKEHEKHMKDTFE